MKRFNVLGDFGQDEVEADDGDWVRYEDHAADRAALVAQLEAAQRETAAFEAACANGERVYDELADKHRVLVSQVAELTRERDEWAETAAVYLDEGRKRWGSAESEVARLTEALAAAERYKESSVDCMRVLEARVRELEAPPLGSHAADLLALRATQQHLAASEARAEQWKADAEGYRINATVAQDRLAALRAKVAAALEWADDGLEGEALAYHMVETLRA